MKQLHRALGVASAAAALAGLLSCGEVPTLPSGVAYISGIIAPALAIAAGDTLRDSTGVVTALRIDAFDRDGNVIPGIPVRFLLTAVDSGIALDSTTGMMSASDSVRPVRVIGQAVGLLQTPEITLQVVPQPDQLQPRAVSDSITANATFGGIVSAPLDLTVSAQRNGARVGVPSILVHYTITRVASPAGAEAQPDTAFALVDDSKKFDVRSPRSAVDTTDGSGLASRRVRVTSDAFDTVYVKVTANNLRGQALAGSPANYVLVRGY